MSLAILVVVLIGIFAIGALYQRWTLAAEANVKDVEALRPTQVSRRLEYASDAPASLLQDLASCLPAGARFSHRSDTAWIAFLGSAARAKTMGLHTAPDAQIPVRVFGRVTATGVEIGLDENLGFQVMLPKAPFNRVMDQLQAEFDRTIE